MMSSSSVTRVKWPVSRMGAFRRREHHQTAPTTGVVGVLERVQALAEARRVAPARAKLQSRYAAVTH